MTLHSLDVFTAWVIPYLPKRFREGRLPYLFFVVWLLIAVMVVLAVITPYPNNVPVPLIFAFFLFVLQALYSWGLPFHVSVYIGLAGGVLQVCFAAWMSGGIFSPRMAWLAAVPLIPFYAVSRLAGLFWLGVVLLVEVVMAYITWQAWLPANPTLGAAQVMSSFATYSVVTLIVITVPFLYDSLFRQAYNASLQRNQELEEKRQELLGTAAMREQFIATVSHELRTPLVSVRGYAELYRMGALQTPEEIGQAMERIEAEAIRMGVLVEDLLELARLDETRPLVLAEVNLTIVAHDASMDVRAQDPERMVRVVALDGSDDVPEVMIRAEENKIRQVITNLLGNALRFTDSGSPLEIAIGTNAGAGEALIAIVDHGEGIPESIRDKIFQRFWRADNSRTRETGGSGLGLAIVSSIVASHEGTVTVEETAGGGATFVVHLPIDGPSQSAV